MHASTNIPVFKICVKRGINIKSIGRVLVPGVGRYWFTDYDVLVSGVQRYYYMGGVRSRHIS